MQNNLEQSKPSNRVLFQKGQSGNPAGKPKGTLSQRGREWKELSEYITGFHTEKFNQYLIKLWDTDPDKACTRLLDILNYFKPRLSSSNNTNNNIEGQTITLAIQGQTINLPDNFKAEDYTEVVNDDEPI